MFELIFISILGLFMGFITSVSGGAGVFAVPTMLAFGFPPIATLALNRMSDLGTVLGSLHNYVRSKSVDWKLAFLIMIPLAIGSFIGARTIVNLSEEALQPIILFGVIVGIIALLKKEGRAKKEHGNIRTGLGYVLLFCVGIWNGGLAMAGATFAVLVLVYFFGKNFLEARSTDIIAAIPETAIATFILVASAQTNTRYVVAMFIASFLGAWIGSHIAVKKGSEFIRKTMVLVAILMMAVVILRM